MSQRSNLQVQINQIDYTLSPPGLLDNCALPLVPIIRIYGATPIGKKACVHIHQVYPYFFVDYNGKLDSDDVNTYIRRLSHSLNHALAISLKRNPLSSKSQFIRAVLIVKGIHFYGFHTSYSPFLKILMVDPSLVSRAVTIMQSGTVMQTRFRVYESHLNYILQFMCDFGLYGCGWIDLDEVWRRGNEVENGDDENSLMDFKLSPHYRESCMALELDVASHQILNRHRLSARNIHHKLEIPAASSPATPLVPSVRELWEDERARRLANGLNPSPDIPIDLSASSRGQGGEWAAEARWWDEIRKRIENERETKVEIGDNAPDWENNVMTTFESVEALWEDDWKTWKPALTTVKNEENTFVIAEPSQLTGEMGENASEELNVEVNETILTSQEMTQLVELEEKDWERLFNNKGILAENDEDALDEEEYVNHNEDVNLNSPSGSQQSHVSQNRNTIPPDGSQVTPLNRPRRHQNINPFQDAWLKIAGLQRSRSASPAREDRRTLMKSQFPPPSGPPSPALTPMKPQDYRTTPSITRILPSERVRDLEIMKLAWGSPRQESLNRTKDSAQLDVFGSMQDDPFLCVEISPPSLNTRENGESNAPEPSTSNKASPSGRQRTDDVPETVLSASSYSSESHTSQPSARLPSFLSATITPTLMRTPRSIRTLQYMYAIAPPTPSELETSLERYGIASKLYKDPYYSKEGDTPDRSREYSGLLYHLRGDGFGFLEEWHVGDLVAKGTGQGTATRRLDPSFVTGWEYASCPPSVKEVKKWLSLDENKVLKTSRKKDQSQIEGPTQKNIYGLDNSPVAPTDASRSRQDMTVLSLELFAPSRDNLVPDPNFDEIAAIFYSFQLSSNSASNTIVIRSGKIVVESDAFDLKRLRDTHLEVVSSELELINQIVDVVVNLDPDIVVGWEIQNASWGYLNARGLSYGIDVGDLISRAPPRPSLKGGIDQWGIRKTSTFKVAGRHALNVWRIMRTELALKSYTFENVAFHTLRRRMPRYSFSTLTKWFKNAIPSHTARILRYFADRTSTVLEILEEAEVITKTAEFARVFGVDFYSVISRGSQFKVESVVFRIVKPESLVLLSPSKQDVGKQNAAECMPLIMEPLSAFYKGPLLVLDFQSLYPSVMIAYNYCYSTCIGRVAEFKGKYKFGVVPDLPQPPGLLERLEEYITVAPNGIMYLKSVARKGLLGRMLSELLDTRVMIKQAMKSVNGDKARKRILDARQHGLKYICNVTYGYTSASFSGRMPAVEIADSIVQTGRETLEKAIRLINSTKKWGAKVVYGDTDSVFVYLPGRTKDQAFRIGNDIADSVTALNPAPIKLKFEKVYLPCVLMAKKRYVGYKYDNPDQSEPTFDAKGIETVRRDGVPAQHKMVEKCLTILFRTQDLSQVKAYCWRSWTKILENKFSIQDFIFAKEVRMGTYSERVPPPPGVMVAARRMLEDQNDEPQYGERIPYVIIRGQPNSRLVDRSVDPRELLDNHHKHLDGAYYISRMLIPPLGRIFNLVGADVRAWYDEMPKSFRADEPGGILLSPKKDSSNVNRFKIDEHFHSTQCLNCGSLALDRICEDCRMKPQVTITNLLKRKGKLERRLVGAHRVCASCTRSAPGEPIECDSLDCPWLFERKKSEYKVEAVGILEECMSDIGLESPCPSVFDLI